MTGAATILELSFTPQAAVWEQIHICRRPQSGTTSVLATGHRLRSLRGVKPRCNSFVLSHIEIVFAMDVPWNKPPTLLL